jgi:hypothetical protein
MASARFNLDKDDIKTLAMNALLVGSAAALTYVGENLAGLDLGNTGLLLVPIVTVALNSAIKWLKDNKKETVDVIEE